MRFGDPNCELTVALSEMTAWMCRREVTRLRRSVFFCYVAPALTGWANLWHAYGVEKRGSACFSCLRQAGSGCY